MFRHQRRDQRGTPQQRLRLGVGAGGWGVGAVGDWEEMEGEDVACRAGTRSRSAVSFYDVSAMQINPGRLKRWLLPPGAKVHGTQQHMLAGMLPGRVQPLPKSGHNNRSSPNCD